MIVCLMLEIYIILYTPRFHRILSWGGSSDLCFFEALIANSLRLIVKPFLSQIYAPENNICSCFMIVSLKFGGRALDSGDSPLRIKPTLKFQLSNTKDYLLCTLNCKL